MAGLSLPCWPASAPPTSATFSDTITIDTAHEQTASYSPKTESSMPLFTITMRSGRTVTEKDAISAAIHEASVSVGYPEDDH